MRIFGALSLALLGACASTPPATHYYQLVVLRPHARQASRMPVGLSIEPLAVDAAYATDRIVYRRSRYRLDYYHYHRWSSAPSLELTDYLRQAYARTGHFTLVTSQPMGEPGTATLTGRILALEEVDESETRWVGRVALELALFDGTNAEPLWSESFVEQEPLDEQSPEGLARALSIALDRVVRKSSGAIAAAAAALTKPVAAERPPRQ